jgi:hypothetical protein
MEEDPKDAQRTDILNQEDIDVEEMCHAQRAAVGKLIAYQSVGYEPAYQYACQEAHYWQENLACHKVEEIEQRFSQDMERRARGAQ